MKYLVILFSILFLYGNVFPQGNNGNEDFAVFTKNLQKAAVKERPLFVKSFINEHPYNPLYEGDTTFIVYWYGKAATVAITGDLQNGWSRQDELKMIKCGDSSFFYIVLHAPKDSRLDYQLIVDKQYQTDPRNPVITPSGYGPHSQVAMPGFSPNPVRKTRTDVAHGVIDTITFFPANGSFKQRLLKVYVPAGTGENLPLLFVYDGIEAIDYISYPAILDNMIADKLIKPLVVVFIGPGDRGEETMSDKTVNFINVISDELVPLVAKKYHTSENPDDRGITGISAGGHLALATVLVRPDVFRCAAGQSSSITAPLLNYFEEYVKDDEKPRLKLYFDVGRFDLNRGPLSKTFVEENSDLHEMLKKNNYPHTFQIVDDGHEWANWRERTSEFLRQFYSY